LKHKKGVVTWGWDEGVVGLEGEAREVTRTRKGSPWEFVV